MTRLALLARMRDRRRETSNGPWRLGALPLYRDLVASGVGGERPLHIVSSPPIIVSVHGPRQRLIGIGTPTQSKNFP